MTEVRSLQPELSLIAGHPLELDDQVEDASFFADLVAYEQEARSAPGCGLVIYSLVCIRFSSFERMFFVFANAPDAPLPEEMKEQIVNFLTERGFVYVPASLLDQDYHRPELIRSWWIRYFDYL